MNYYSDGCRSGTNHLLSYFRRSIYRVFVIVVEMFLLGALTPNSKLLVLSSCRLNLNVLLTKGEACLFPFEFFLKQWSAAS